MLLYAVTIIIIIIMFMFILMNVHDRGVWPMLSIGAPRDVPRPELCSGETACLKLLLSSWGREADQIRPVRLLRVRVSECLTQASS